MSHYPILVTNTDKVDVHEQLAPYDENGGEDEKYFEFDVEVEKGKERDFINKQIKEYEKRAEEVSEIDRREYCYKKAQQFKDALGKTDEELHKYIQEFWDYEEEDGNLGYRRNLNAKWDWYSIGGRWDNNLELKDGRRANVALKKEIKPEHLKDPYLAILHNGEWHQKGEMWYFAIVAGEKADEDWQKEWDKIVASIDDDSEITLVDIHI